MKKLLLLTLTLLFSLPLTACGSLRPTEEQPRERRLTLEGRRYSYTGDEQDLQIQDDVLTIRRGGDYYLSGELKEGAIRICVPPDACVRLILEGVTVTSSYHTPLWVEQAACLTLELTAGSVNRLTDEARSTTEGSPLPLACLAAACPILLCGEGSLIVSGRADTAVASLGTVHLESARLTVSAPSTGIWARDALMMTGGSLTVTEARRGVAIPKSDHTVGAITVTGGHLVALCTETALSAPIVTAPEPLLDLRAPVRIEAMQK